ncbi:MAG: sigma-70 family RNA polymerase sigma factor [Pseudomonadota bacterium]
MIPDVPVRQDDELERLYAQARNYDLLSREEEQDIDARKWSAIHQLLDDMVEDPCSRHYLARWAKACCEPLPEIDCFKDRKHRLLLRRELADFLPEGDCAKKTKTLAASFKKPYAKKRLVGHLHALDLPSSFVVGMAEAVIYHDLDHGYSAVAAALDAWELHWTREYADVSSPKSATKKALRKGIREYTEARDLLIKHNLRLVFTIAGRNRNKGIAFTDLVQEGNLGLLRAAEKFQFKRGYRFSTYAFNWITQGIKRHVADSAGTIRYPAHVQEQLGKVHGERGRQLASLGIAPLDAELASAIGLPVKKTRELLQLRNFGVSFDTPSHEEDGRSTLLDATSGGPFPEPGQEAEQASLNDRLLREIEQLDAAEQRVVIQRWGLHDGPPLSRAEIADQMSVSREWVRQLEQSALNKLGESEMMKMVFKDHLRSRS